VSVAFRRESDDEHKEPKFELPIPAGPNIVTARGLRLIGETVARLEAELAAASDDAQREEVKRDLRYWHTRQATAQLAPAPPQDEVAFGSRVHFKLNGQARTIDIVGDDEADPAEGRIAFSAPLAQALMGGFVGEEIDFGNREKAIKISRIESLPA
jgi:transcription elongation GreA/GreB family factor